MTAPPQSCATCKMADPDTDWPEDTLLKCGCGFEDSYVPASISWEKTLMYPNEGKCCPCYERKDT